MSTMPDNPSSPTDAEVGNIEDYMADRRAEVRLTLGRVIARAWSDHVYKAALIADPRTCLAAEGLDFPERYVIEIYDDPSAEFGDWHSIGRGVAAVHRFPIPSPPLDADLSSESLEGSVAQVACCSPCASCTGAVSLDTWY